ncbi:unnamed protein product [Strongylus vulgaris]|uniref:Uncharacterized protein n=1 Tax=Strongylus vulgaris TaxID=40348 RepID=A0A3P7LBV9_STRVU|nr:unnamed protein product [Strongylus vulgaris]
MRLTASNVIPLLKHDRKEEEEDNSPSGAELRLPKSIKPVSYELSLQTYLPSYVDFPPEKDFTFDADVVMKLNVLERVDKIVLNMRNITIHKDRCYLTVAPALFPTISVASVIHNVGIELRRRRLRCPDLSIVTAEN